MKKIGIITLSFICLMSFLPINAFAEEVIVGLDIEGQMTISAVTTINTTLKLDLNTREITNSYLRSENTGNVDLDFSIIDIVPASVDSPGTFVSYSTTEPVAGKDWLQLNEAETKQYISFGVSTGTLDYQTIMPDTTIKLGRIFAYYDNQMGGMADYREDEFREAINPSRSFSLIAKTGYVWGSVTNLSYTITTLVEASVEPDIINPSKHAKINDIKFAVSVSSEVVANPTIFATYNTDLDYVELTASDLYFKGTITTPSGDTYPFENHPSEYNTFTGPTSIFHEMPLTITGYTFTETGTHYISINFGFEENDVFIPENNYSQVISVTVYP